ncbi:uncharacterized protein SCHCODRAFT_02496837 [Schizophyllum commune H4-8]|nr:uncharacterized protein SCHCODRAFT_02496837 [Schizophyllum commune H4-8]KAI5894822.1 hypothetical protein SCHCODRAFT_02496837 [Schizophyllum commune H4-8]
MIAFIQHEAPEVFTKVLHKNVKFCCSKAYVREFLCCMGWGQRAATRAAQKLPENHQRLIYESLLREALVVRNFGVPDRLCLNTDQTQLVYQQGVDHTWNKHREAQVHVLGHEEKRTFTLVPGIAASGHKLPYQAVFAGQELLAEGKCAMLQRGDGSQIPVPPLG